MAELSTAVQDAIRRVVDDLVEGRYAMLARDGRAGRLTAEELERAIRDYGRALVPLPPDAMRKADVYPIEDVAGELAVDIPLWTKEEGRSDLTLSLTVVERAGGVTISIDDLHVL
jgi:hypothetical protein